jgi:hypothetical protein
MTVERFTKTAGSDVLQSVEDPSMALVGCDVPDYVHLPPELGGAQIGVKYGVHKECPRGEHVVKHLVLEGGLAVAECPAHGGFLWYRVPQ